VKLLLDQSSDARLITYLRLQGHDATRIAIDYPSGLPDTEVLAIAAREGRILITDDRDFGELVFVQRHAHTGVIYLRFGSTPIWQRRRPALPSCWITRPIASISSWL
jgi:predicted nuclease of predicted toxin-antitoxin system